MKQVNNDTGIIVTDDGFHPDDWTAGYLAWEGEATLEKVGPKTALDIPNSLAGSELTPVLDRLAMVRVPFPTHADGRGFSIARNLRLMGYRGRLRARGKLLADQYAMARRCGFDEVEIDQDIAQRQTEPQWLSRADWRQHDYQQRLRCRE